MDIAQRRTGPRFWGLACLAFFGLFFVKELDGQYYRTYRSYLQSVTENSRWRLGPLWINPDLQFNLVYDSSIYGTYGEREPVPDYIATAAVPLDIHLIVRERLIFTFTEIPSYLRFFEQTDESSFNNSYALGARWRLFRPLVLTGLHESRRAKYRFSSEVERRIFERVEANGGSAFLETARGSAFGLSGSTRRYRYQDEILPGAADFASTVLNRKEDNVQLEFYRPASPDSAFFMNFGYTDYAFESPESSGRDSYSYQANAGIRLPLLGKARGLLSLGYKSFKPRDAGQDGYSGLIGNTELDYRFSRIGLRLQLVRDVVFSYVIDSLFFVDSRLGAGLSFYPTRNIRLDYDVSAGTGDYSGTTLVTLPDGTRQAIERKDTYVTHSGSLIFRVRRNTGIGFRADFQQRESNDFYYNMDRWSAGLYLTYDF